MRSKMKALTVILVAVVMFAIAPSAQAVPALVGWSGGGFTQIQDGFTAEVVAQGTGFLGGVAFAADGDIMADNCQFSGSNLQRWDVQAGTTSVHGSDIYMSKTTLSSNAGCGLTTHSDGFLYSNTNSGVVKLDPDTGAQVGAASGGGGNALGITEDPLTGELYWVSGDIKAYDPVSGTITNSAFANNGGFTDGIFWNPDGTLLYTTDRTHNTVDVFDRTGTLVDSHSLGHEPDGIAFSALSGFVLTNNTDGTISRIDADGTVSLFATGGSRGDLAHVGSDGFWYITQAGTRYADGTTSSQHSIVRIGPAGTFAPPPGVDPVPEPATILLLGSGLFGLGLFGRKRMKG